MRKIKRLENELSELQKVVRFLLHNDREDIAVFTAGSLFGHRQGLKYIKNDTVCSVSCPWLGFRAIEFVKKDTNKVVFRAYTPYNVAYFMLNKEEETIVEIPKPDFVKEEKREELKPLGDKKMIKNINIQMIGTSQDVRLLKKIFKHYLETKATESEKHHIETYIGLIDHAVEKTLDKK